METYRNLRFVDSRMHTVYLIRTIQWNIPDTLHMRELSLLLHPRVALLPGQGDVGHVRGRVHTLAAARFRTRTSSRPTSRLRFRRAF